LISDHFKAVKTDTQFSDNLATWNVDFILPNLVDVYWQLQKLLPLPSLEKLVIYPSSAMKVEVAGIWNVVVPLYWTTRCLFSGDIQYVVCAYI
jgi:hypothetical protein